MIPLRDQNPTRRPALLTWGLILLNVGIYLFLAQSPVMDQQAIQRYALVPADIVAGHHYGTLITSMFLHASLLHVGGNMLFLWIFGNNVEDAMGPVKYFFFYILGGIAALALQVAIHPNETAPTLGASGAIAAVLGGYILLYPRARVLTLIFIILFFTVIELPAIVVLGLWFAQQIAFGAAGLTSPGASGGVAYFAHIGGFVFGLATVKLLARRRRSVPPRYPVY